MAGAPWWEEDYEKNFYEAIIVVVLVLLAMIFESFFHTLTHSAEHSYAYGASRDEHQNKVDRAHVHKQPFKELAQHLGTEFMTLGFLACVIFLGNISGFFEFLADLAQNAYADSSASGDSYGGSDAAVADASSRRRSTRRLAGESDGDLLIGPWSMAMPRDAGHFLHLTEEVHIRMFFGMIIYFGIVYWIIQEGVARIKEWAELTNRKILMEVHKFQDPHDSELTQYLEITKYTIYYMLNWQAVNQDRWEILVNTIYDESEFVPNEDQELCDEVKIKLNRSFSLGHYLASTLEDGLVDIIEIHRVTWVTLMSLFIFFMFLHQQQVKMVYIAGVILLIGVFGMGMTYRQIRNQDRNIEHFAHVIYGKEKNKEAGKLPTGTTSEELPNTESKRRHFAARCHFSQFIFLRVYETTLFVWCYSFASLVFNKEGWEHDFLVSVVEVLLYTIFTVVAASFLPTVVTHLFIQYSLPPSMDEHHFKILMRTISDHDPALWDLARTGADEILEAVQAANELANCHANRSRVNTNASDTSGGQRNRPLARSRGGTNQSDLDLRGTPEMWVVAPTIMEKDLSGMQPPVAGSLAEALSEVLETPEGLKLLQKMAEEAARRGKGVKSIDRASAPVQLSEGQSTTQLSEGQELHV